MSLTVDLPKSWEDWSIVGEEPIGRGSYGTVYKAQRELGDRKVFSAVKIIDIPHDEDELQNIRLEYNDEESVKAYFLDIKDSYVKEIELMADFRGISNIVSIEDFLVEPKEEIGWRIYIRMEYLEDLRLWIRENELTEEEVVKIASDICNALIYCEKEHIIHRDIKPANILRSPLGDYKLGDFGVAMISKQGSGSYSSKGTFEYMAPEVYKGEHYGMSADIYSLGIVLYWLTNRTHEKNRNRFPFESTYKEMLTYKEKENALTRRMNGEVPADPANASPALSRIILKACAYDPKDRYQSASEMLQDLNGLKTAAAKIPASAPKEESSANIHRTLSHRIIFVIAIVIIVAALVIAGLGIGRHFSGNESGRPKPEEAWVEEMTQTEQETQEQPTEAPVTPQAQAETEPFQTETMPVTETKTVAQEITETETKTAVLEPAEMIETETVTEEMTEMTETETVTEEITEMTETETVTEEMTEMTETETITEEITEMTETETVTEEVTEMTGIETAAEEVTETTGVETAAEEVTEMTESEIATEETTEKEQTERTGLLIIERETESQSEESVSQKNEEIYQEYKEIIDEAIDGFFEDDPLYTVDLIVGQSETPGAAIVWEDIIGYSSDVSVVTVSEEGKVTAVGPGTAYVFLMAEDAVKSAREIGEAPTSQVFRYNVSGEASENRSTEAAGSDGQLALEDLSRQLDEWNSAG